MKMITIENLSKTYGEKELFRNISFTITEKERIGLIGINGTGKSTLLRVIAGIDTADSGEVIAANDYSIAYLAQEPALDESRTVLEQVFQSDAPSLRLLKEYEHAVHILNKTPEDARLQEQLVALQQKMDTHQAWDANTRAQAILSRLGIERFDQPIGELSGGQKKRVALAQVLIESPDLLILDEPTNHLDFEAVKWLEDFIYSYPGAVLLVTHDRYFLDRVTNRMFELENQTIYRYLGNYASYLEAKALREESEAASLDKAHNLFRQELEWMKRGARARSTKQKARIQRFEQLENKLASQQSTEQMDITLSGSRLGRQVLQLKNATKRFGDKIIFQDFDLLLKRGDRFGIIGNNGTGKSTLLNVLAQKLPLDEGELLTGQTVKIAYYTQAGIEMDESKRMIEYINDSAQMITTSDGKTISSSQMLERFLFPTYTHGAFIRTLSGGERRRLYLLKLLMDGPNVLLLDEPTNDLDTTTLTVLEDYLDQFPGVVVTVSHDRYFLDKVVDQLLILKGDGEIDTYFGGYTDYIEAKQASEKRIIKEEAKKIAPSTQGRTEKVKKQKLTYMERKEWETIDEKIAALEKRLEAISVEMEGIGSDFEKGQQLSEEEMRITAELEVLIERWGYLAEIAEND